MRTVAKDGVIISDGSFRFLLGVNYWARRGNIAMWASWDPESIREDFKLMSEVGIRVVRAFIRNEDFADEQGNLLEDAARKLGQFLDIANEAGVKVLLTLLVGHMSGKNWRIPWTPNDKVYSPDSVSKTCNFVAQVVSRFKSHPAIAGWILSNEISLVARASSRGEALNLLRACSLTIKAIDENHVFSSGDLPDGYLQETPNVRGLVDYVGPHLYLYDNDAVRHGFTYSMVLEVFKDIDYPVILEEFGFSPLQFSEESLAQFVREILYSALAHGASGALFWCFGDFEDKSYPPYEWRPHELIHGLFKLNGEPRLTAKAFKDFAKDLSLIEALNLHSRFKRVSKAAVVVPYYVFADYEFIWYRNALGFWGSIKPAIMSLSLTSSLGLSPMAVYEKEISRAFDKQVIIMPSVINALTSTWRMLLSFVEKGGLLITSIVRGVNNLRAYHEAPTQLWGELFGVAPALRAGSEGIRLRDRVIIKGSLKGMEEVPVNIPGEVIIHLVKPIDAEPLAYINNTEAPVLLRARRGKGYAYLLTLPIELILGLQEEAQWSLRSIYEAVFNDAGINLDYKSSEPSVEVVQYTDGAENLVFAINHSDKQVETIISVPRGSSVRQITGDAKLIAASGNKVTFLMPPKSAVTFIN